MRAKRAKPEPYVAQPGDVMAVAPYAWRIEGGEDPGPELWRLWFTYYWPDKD